MASLALINEKGVKIQLACSHSLPPGFKIPEGQMLSYGDQPSAESWCEKNKDGVIKIIRHESAIARLEILSCTVVIRIESPVADDLFELRDIVTLLIGGSIIPAQLPMKNEPSCWAGIKGDFTRLKKRITTFTIGAKQSIGMKLASL